MTSGREISVRRANKADYSSVNRLLLELHQLDRVGSPLSPLKKNPSSIFTSQQYAAILSEYPKSCILVALSDDKVVGIVYSFVEESAASNETFALKQPAIGSLYVLPRYRRARVASQLLGEIENWAKLFGQELSTVTYAYNKATQSFFKHHGFVVRSVRLNKKLG